MRGSVTQTGRNYFFVRDDESPGYFFTATTEVSAHLLVTWGSHLYVNYSSAQKKLVKNAFLIEEVNISPTCVHVGHGYVPQTGSVSRGERCVWYHSYLLQKNHDLPSEIAFPYGTSTALRSKGLAVRSQ